MNQSPFDFSYIGEMIVLLLIFIVFRIIYLVYYLIKDIFNKNIYNENYKVDLKKKLKQEIIFILKLLSIPFLVVAQLIVVIIKILNSILIEDMKLDKYLEKKFNEYL